MAFWQNLVFWKKAPQARHLERGVQGEAAARGFLEKKGLKFLTANYAGKRGEIDLVCRDGPCLVFVEVKTRSVGGWTRPARAVTVQKRRALFRTAADYLKSLGNPLTPYRFDVVEVLLEGASVAEIRHIENSFDRSMLSRRRTR